MHWTPELAGKLRQEWALHRGEGRLFDLRFSIENGCTARAVRDKRRRLGLMASFVEPPPARRSVQELDDLLDGERQRLQQAAGRRELKKAVREAVRLESIGEQLLEAVQKLPAPTPFKRPESPKDRSEEIVVVISDVQLGQKSHSDYLGDIVRYSKEIFEKRLENFTAQVGRIIGDRQKVLTVPSLRVFFLGDIIDGQEIFRGQPFEIDQSVVDQVMKSVQGFSAALSNWSRLVPEISVHAIPGNHGLVNYQSSRRDNWEILIYQMLASQLANHTNIFFDIQKSPFHEVEVLGWRFFLTHGDELKGRNPVNAALRMEGDWRGLLHGVGRKSFDYYLFGHHHRHIQIESNGGEVICNGCWPGGSSYSVGRLGLISKPSQFVLGVSEEEGVSWRYRVNLESVAS